jgi:hypothetical protein
MTDAPETPEPLPPETSATTEVPAHPPPRRMSASAWLVLLAFLALAVSQAAQWHLLLNPTPQPDPLAPRVEALAERIARLEARPPPSTPDLVPLEARLTALEQAVQAVKSAQQTSASAVSPDQIAALAERLQAAEARLAVVEKAASAPASLTEQVARAARVQAAFLALSDGRPLGNIPGAAPALARYATEPPPTEAALRIAFPAAAKAALAAQLPAPADQPWLSRIWQRARDLITVRQGEHVLVGNPDAGTLARARAALDAGDVAEAVAAVSTLTGPPAQAIAGWLDQARGLLAARAALADMATHS